MLKIGLYIIVILGVGLLIVLLQGKSRTTNISGSDPTKKQLILHRQGAKIALNDQSPYYKDLIEQCEKLFEEADRTPRLIMSKDRIERIKDKQTALELILPRIQIVKLKNQQTVHYTKLLIPLTDEFSDGTIFFAGAYEHNLGGKTPEYSSLMEYGAINFVRNGQGVNGLKQILQDLHREE